MMLGMTDAHRELFRKVEIQLEQSLDKLGLA